MANNFTKNPWIIDTAAATVLSSDMLAIDKFRWVDATTAGHTCEVTDKNGKMIWASEAAGDNFIDDSSSGGRLAHEIRCNGLIVPTLESGKLYIYLH